MSAVSFQPSAVGFLTAPSLQVFRIGGLTAAPYFVLGASGNCLPTTITDGESDVRGGDAKPLDDVLTAPREYILFTNAKGAGAHDEAGAASLFSQRDFVWLDETLAAIR